MTISALQSQLDGEKIRVVGEPAEFENQIMDVNALRAPKLSGVITATPDQSTNSTPTVSGLAEQIRQVKLKATPEKRDNPKPETERAGFIELVGDKINNMLLTPEAQEAKDKAAQEKIEQQGINNFTRSEDEWGE